MKRGGVQEKGGSGPPDPPPSGHAYEVFNCVIIRPRPILNRFNLTGTENSGKNCQKLNVAPHDSEEIYICTKNHA